MATGYIVIKGTVPICKLITKYINTQSAYKIHPTDILKEPYVKPNPKLLKDSILIKY